MLSRVADSLYWMSRHIERAEHTARLVDVNLSLSLEQSQDAANRRWQRVLSGLRARPLRAGNYADPDDVAYWLIFNTTNPGSVASCVQTARDNARQVREQISTQMWEQINRMYLRVRKAREAGEWNDNLRDYLVELMENSHLIQGVTAATLNRGESWHFIQAARYIERASNTASLLDVHFSALQSAGSKSGARLEETDAYLDWVGLLNSCAALDAYRKVYPASLRPDRVAEFLVLNPEFPHSICFAAQEMENCLRAIGKSTKSHRAKRVNSAARRMRATMRFSQAENLMLDGLSSHLRYVMEQCGAIHVAIHQAYITYPVEEELTT